MSVVDEPAGRRRGRRVPVAHRQAAPARRRGRGRVHRRPQGVRPQQDPPRPEHGPARGQDLDDPRAVGHRQVRVHQAHGRPALSRRRRHPRPRRVGPEHAGRRAVRDAQEVRRPVPGRRAVRLDERLRQHRLPAAPAHGQGRGRDHRHRHAPPARRSASGRRGDKMPNELSGGMRKRAGLRARARARPRHRPLRRARLGPGPGAHRPAGRAHPGDPRRDDGRARGHRPARARLLRSSPTTS